MLKVTRCYKFIDVCMTSMNKDHETHFKQIHENSISFNSHNQHVWWKLMWFASHLLNERAEV